MTKLARIYLVRHGETSANQQKIIQGHLDTPLNSTGFEQAMLVAKALRVVPFDLAYTSDLSRATDTATAILHCQPGLELRKDAKLRERFMGELQGQAYGSTKLPIGESTIETGPAFASRTLAWWRETIVDHISSLPDQDQPYNIVVVSHGGFISTMVRNLIKSRWLASDGRDLLPSLPNASVSLIEWDGETWKLKQYGDASHLSMGPLDYNADEIRI